MPDQDSIRYKYDPLPEEPRYKKRRKKAHVRSDHKHDYEQVCVDTHSETVTREGRFPSYCIAVRCRICGRLKDVKLWQSIRKPPEGMPLYEVDRLLDLIVMKAIPDEMKVCG